MCTTYAQLETHCRLHCALQPLAVHSPVKAYSSSFIKIYIDLYTHVACIVQSLAYSYSYNQGVSERSELTPYFNIARTDGYQYMEDLLALDSCSPPFEKELVQGKLEGVCSPLLVDHWEEMLSHHKDRNKYLLSGIKKGFRIGFYRVDSA